MTITEILREYQSERAYYALCLFSDERKIELKYFKSQIGHKPTFDEWDILAAIIPPKPTPEETEIALQNNLKSEILSRPAFALTLVTHIANIYRKEIGKVELTETQVKTRLLA